MSDSAVSTRQPAQPLHVSEILLVRPVSNPNVHASRAIFFDRFFARPVAKIPLGKLSPAQLAAGARALKDIETLIHENKSSQSDFDEFKRLTNVFYTKVRRDWRPALTFGWL